MASTYTISTYQQMGNNKTLLSLFNGSGSGVIAKIYKIWVMNHAHVAGNSTYTKILLSRTSNATGGTDISGTVVRHLMSSSLPPSQFTVTHSSTLTVASTFRQLVYASGTSATTIGATYTINQFQSIMSLMRIFECGYYNTNLEPIVLREGEGLGIANNTTTTNGFAEIMVEFTLE